MANKSNQVPKWVWMITPTLAIAFLGFILYLTTIPPDSELEAVKGDARKVMQASVDKVKKEPVPTPQKPNYDFYKLLEKQTVEVPKVGAYKSTPKDEVVYEYRLQVGSFRSQSDAERLRASLLLEGMSAYSQSVEANGNTWHRVMVGPFTDRSKMNRAYDELVARNIKPLELREARSKAK